jgi:hypothetical protein
MALDLNDTQEEKDFRVRYAYELSKKKVSNSASSHFNVDELLDEQARVKHQAMITPGRRGEQIKQEEISREILRRIAVQSKK